MIGIAITRSLHLLSLMNSIRAQTPTHIADLSQSETWYVVNNPFPLNAFSHAPRYLGFFSWRSCTLSVRGWMAGAAIVSHSLNHAYSFHRRLTYRGISSIGFKNINCSTKME